jgi:hypothetical protein
MCGREMCNTRRIRGKASGVGTTMSTINIEYLVRDLEESRDIINIDIINIIHDLDAEELIRKRRRQMLQKRLDHITKRKRISRSTKLGNPTTPFSDILLNA